MAAEIERVRKAEQESALRERERIEAELRETLMKKVAEAQEEAKRAIIS